MSGEDRDRDRQGQHGQEPDGATTSPESGSEFGSPDTSPPRRGSPAHGNRSSGGGGGRTGGGRTGGGSGGVGRGREQGASSFLRSSTRLIRRTLSTSASGDRGSPPPPPQRQQQNGALPASLELFKTVSLPMARGEGGGHEHPTSMSSGAAQRETTLQGSAVAGAKAAPVASSSTMSWFGSSIGSALSSLGSSAAGGGGGGGNGVTRLTPAFSPKEGEKGTPPSARLTPASPASASSAFERETDSRPAGGSGGVDSSGDGGDGGVDKGRARASPPRGAVTASPARQARLGRDPTECPCGAAELYRSVVEGDGKGATATAVAVAMVSAGGEAIGAETAAAELRAKAFAAHKLIRAKAYAHLLTRAKKAMAYADLQVSENAAVYPRAGVAAATHAPRCGIL